VILRSAARHQDGNQEADDQRNKQAAVWSNPMPVLLWLLGVPIVVTLALYVFHIL
jgi:hypothetical protein